MTCSGSADEQVSILTVPDQPCTHFGESGEMKRLAGLGGLGGLGGKPEPKTCSRVHVRAGASSNCASTDP